MTYAIILFHLLRNKRSVSYFLLHDTRNHLGAMTDSKLQPQAIALTLEQLCQDLARQVVPALLRRFHQMGWTSATLRDAEAFVTKVVTEAWRTPKEHYDRTIAACVNQTLEPVLQLHKRSRTSISLEVLPG